MTKDKETIGLKDRLPTNDEIKSAGEAATALAIAMEHDGALKISGPDGQVSIAPALGALMIELLGHISNGNMVTLVPRGATLTTQQAADMLNVSRPYLTKLLKKGAIAFTPVGAHRRVKFDDLMAYKERIEREKDEALTELIGLGQQYDQMRDEKERRE